MYEYCLGKAHVLVLYIVIDSVTSASPLAQLVERETVNLEAVGSTPTWRGMWNNSVIFYLPLRAF